MDIQRPAQLGHQHFRQPGRRRTHVALLDQDHELVATEAGEQRVVAAVLLHRLADAVGELQQRLVAGLVAEGVVDPLEVVDVGEQQRQLAAGAAQQHQAVVQALAERQPVGEPGERVGVGHAPHLAVMAGHRLAHPAECADQVAHLVVARAVQALDRVVARFDPPCRRRQPADRAHQGALHIPGSEEGNQRQQAEGQGQPADMALGQVVHQCAELGQVGPLVAVGDPQVQAHPYATDPLAADHDRRRGIQHVGRGLQVQAIGGDGLGGEGVVHHPAVVRDLDRPVVHQPPFKVVDLDVADRASLPVLSRSTVPIASRSR